MSDWPSLIVETTTFVGSVIVIAAVVVFLWALRHFLRDRAKASAVSPESKPAAERTVRDQLLQPSPRTYCYVNSEEVRRLFPGAVGEPVSGHTRLRTDTTTTRQVEGDARVIRAGSSSTEEESREAELEPPSEYELLERLMQALVRKDAVAFGLESGLPDKVRLDSLEEGLQRIGKSGLDLQPYAKVIQEHRKKLQSGGVASTEDKVDSVDKVRAKYAYAALKGSFECCSSSPSSVGLAAGARSADTLRMKVAGVNLDVGLPADRVSGDTRHLFLHGRTLDNVFVFGSLSNWSKDGGATLTITPLAVSLSWTST